MEEKTYTPILPFEDTVLDTFLCYDNVKYKRDLDVAQDGMVMLHNPNLIKYYETNSNEAVKIGGD